MESTAALRGDIGDALRRVGFPIAVIDSAGRVARQNDAMVSWSGTESDGRSASPSSPNSGAELASERKMRPSCARS